jgi:hypothetical protein
MADLLEEYKTIPLYPDYEVSTLGNVRRIRDNKLMKHYPQKNGYDYVIITRGYGTGWVPIHRLVAMTFLGLEGYKEGLYVDHINTNRSDNRVENLRWVTPKGNANNEQTKLNRKASRLKKFHED